MAFPKSISPEIDRHPPVAKDSEDMANLHPTDARWGSDGSAD